MTSIFFVRPGLFVFHTTFSTPMHVKVAGEINVHVSFMFMSRKCSLKKSFENNASPNPIQKESFFCFFFVFFTREPYYSRRPSRGEKRRPFQEPLPTRTKHRNSCFTFSLSVLRGIADIKLKR